ncbi:uncharacterized protein C8Q71DRAFT_786327 [Rhodofomes roseus]|uniref:Uncharacterized protein n=1 Tax=Rhodofomes roseus TaxID=34475 RepID=A0ABQ8K0P0_9APHY|nr:uncharacterized protein C8Q71DRAFT_786327 [Rhodofomes roseus]KAH9830254.1 hypothetical protein C8Q71DRAFT_786327 [Rhodofomes roseus]
MKRQARHGPVRGIAVHNSTNDAAKVSLVCSRRTRMQGRGLARPRGCIKGTLYVLSALLTLLIAQLTTLIRVALTACRSPLRSSRRIATACQVPTAVAVPITIRGTQRRRHCVCPPHSRQPFVFTLNAPTDAAGATAPTRVALPPRSLPRYIPYLPNHAR